MDRWGCVECGKFHGETCCRCGGAINALANDATFEWSEPFIGTQAYNDRTTFQRTLVGYFLPVFCPSCNASYVVHYVKRNEAPLSA